MIDNYELSKANYEVLKEILDLQHLAYITEAKIYNDMNIEPLTETLDELINEYNNGLVIKLSIDNKIIGSIRAKEKNNTVFIGKLMVHPDYRRNGFGSLLLTELEKMYPNKRYELFTGVRSLDNVRLYERLGYKPFKMDDGKKAIQFVYFEKY